MYHGLGEAYINVFLRITACGFAAAIIVAVIIRLLFRVRLERCVSIASVLGIALAYAGNSFLHHDLFVRNHQSHNSFMPKEGCLTYEPSFGHLFASYAMSRNEFEQWVSIHPWKLKPYDLALVEYDSKRLNFAAPEVAYATEMAPDGGQLRVYFRDGVMYVSYNVM
ncbi:MAG: hypothetical protein MUC83_02130 [Pirellula sp.]|nr:hypothetical protein [Pirellula sp.]